MQAKPIFVCSNCDAQFPKWSGRCFECGAWGTLESQNAKVKVKSNKKDNKSLAPAGEVMTFADLAEDSLERLFTEQAPAKTIFPKGMPLGSLTLLGGEPGAGKSTLALQLALNFAQQNSVLYFSAEESGSQVKEKIERLGKASQSFLFSAENNLETIAATISKHKVQLAVIDSIQTVSTEEVTTEAGSLAQLKACTVKLLEIAKETKVALVIIGHVTKDGALAGPKTLEHLVDIVFYLEGSSESHYRLLRSTKNRYGAAGKVSVLHMTNNGLQVVKQAATAFITNYQAKPGSVVTAIVDSGQVFFIEVQSLVTASNFGYAKRTASGFPVKRLEVLLAVMKKRLQLNFDSYDVYVNLVGGFQLKDPALDLAVCLSLISGLKNKVLGDSTVVFGEVGLAGELRLVKDTSLRLEEISKHNFKKVILPPVGKTAIKGHLDIVNLESLEQVLTKLGW